jgi:hypothetical protein
MITLTTEQHSSYTGDTITYEDAATTWLFEQALATDDIGQRAFAAAGLVRAVLDIPINERRFPDYFTAIDWSVGLLLSARGNPEEAQNQAQMNDYVARLPMVNAKLDSVSVTATRANEPSETARIIKEQTENPSDPLVIALGHGGIIPAADTFISLNCDNKLFYPVRYSRRKLKDESPVLAYPELEMLRIMAKDRPVVVIDDDRGLMSSTISQFTIQMSELLSTDVYGVTPVHSMHPSRFWPQVLRSNGHKGTEILVN